MGHHQSDRKEWIRMSVQQQLFPAEVFGTVPAALVVLMTILALLGVIAHAAIA